MWCRPFQTLVRWYLESVGLLEVSLLETVSNAISGFMSCSPIWPSRWRKRCLKLVDSIDAKRDPKRAADFKFALAECRKDVASLGFRDGGEMGEVSGALLSRWWL
ncbi:unnamed protein product [Durusdinium trenchii]|uniref:Uncharacterized protein n=1 Tax=Durusdinium trenchii TaxID=1381693 RepID=A0ABP0N6P6_9DINO